MVIDSSRRPSPPLNGDVAIATAQGPGHFEEVDLDYIEWFRDPRGRIVFQCYDTAGNIVKICIRESVLEDMMFPNSGLHTPSTPPEWGNEEAS